MSQINFVVIKGGKKANFEDHYTLAMNIIQNNDFKQLSDYLEENKGRSFSAEPIDAGVIIFDLKKKTIDGRNQSGFNAHNLKRIPPGWKFIETGRNQKTDIITSANLEENKKKWDSYLSRG